MASSSHRAGVSLLGLTILSSLTGSGCGVGAVEDPEQAYETALAEQGDAGTTRVDLNILVLLDGQGPGEAVQALLDEELVRYETIDLKRSPRAAITSETLVDRSVPGVRRAKYQAIVLPTAQPAQLSADEWQAIQDYERTYKVRQLDAHSSGGFARLGLDGAAAVSAPLDGATLEATAAGQKTVFSYLRGSITMPNDDPNQGENWGWVPPLPKDSASFTTLVTIPVPTTDEPGVLVGLFAQGGREEMVLTASIGAQQLAMKALFPGILRWLTYGVHEGLRHDYLAVHVDDLFMSNDRFDAERHDDPSLPETKPHVVMSAENVDELIAWQNAAGMKLDLAYNGGAYREAVAAGSAATGPVAARQQYGKALLDHRDEFRWINHTYEHKYLGCARDAATGSEDCAGKINDRTGFWTDLTVVQQQISQNIEFASEQKLTLERDVLVTGEHGGLNRPARGETTDNPNFLAGLSFAGAGPLMPSYQLAWVASDTSIEGKAQRRLNGPAGTTTYTVPRYPMHVYYNVGSKQDLIDEFNYTYAWEPAGHCRRECEKGPSLDGCLKNCVPKLTGQSGFDYVANLEARNVFLRVASNDPRPHYAHQSNLAEDHILYDVLDRVRARHAALFDERQVPLDNPGMGDIGRELRARDVWQTARARVEAYLENGQLKVKAPAGVRLPLTVPTDSKVEQANVPVWGVERAGWVDVARELTITLPASVPLGR